MSTKELLTENEVIEGTRNFLERKGRTARKKLLVQADAEARARGVDLKFRLENECGRGNTYFIEAKGNMRSDGRAMKSAFNTNFRWAISQIVLRIAVDSRNNNYIYGIAVPDAEISKCIALIHDNWALKHLKIRLYGAYRDGGALTAREYLPSAIYDGKLEDGAKRSSRRR